MFAYGWFQHNLSTIHCKRHGKVLAMLGRNQTYIQPNANVVVTFSVNWGYKYAPFLCAYILTAHVLSVRPIIARFNDFCALFNRFQLFKKLWQSSIE